MLSAKDKIDFECDGFVVARGLFGPEEVETLRAHFMALREAGSYEGDMVAESAQSNDPLKRYPRMIHMHRWDERSLQWLLDARLNQCLSLLLGEEPLAVQTMLYFKPPGARGQALHQDNFYLRAQPGTCMAAWLALDKCDAENGCMQVVPGSHLWPLLCPEKADAKNSFTDVTVPVPDHEKAVAVEMEAGDVLFFNGTLVHGSFPNTSPDRFRRSLIGHYIESRARQVTAYDQPVLRMDGTAFEISKAEGGGACGVWVEEDGTHVVEMRGSTQNVAHE